MPKGYIVLWAVITLAYVVWMTCFMGSDTYPAAETGMTNPAYYPVWTVFSAVLLMLFPVYIKAFLFGREPGKALRIFCLANLIFGCAFVTWYGFFKDPQKFTASMIGLEYPWHFKMWGLFSSLSVYTNVLYMYRRNGFYSRVGTVCGALGSAAIFVTINVPSAGEDLILSSLRCMSHWTGALVFAFLLAISVVVFIGSRAKTKDKKYIALLVVYAAILAAMLVLLVAVGKDGIIENLPMWATYIVLFLVNFTGLFRQKQDAPAAEEAKIPATV